VPVVSWSRVFAGISSPEAGSNEKVASVLPEVMLNVSGSLSASDAAMAPTDVLVVAFSTISNIWAAMVGAVFTGSIYSSSHATNKASIPVVAMHFIFSILYCFISNRCYQIW
jgi:hypothetical protein